MLKPSVVFGAGVGSLEFWNFMTFLGVLVDSGLWLPYSSVDVVVVVSVVWLYSVE